MGTTAVATAVVATAVVATATLSSRFGGSNSASYRGADSAQSRWQLR